MQDSDDDYVQSQSDDDNNGQPSSGKQKGQTGKSGSGNKSSSGFEVSRTWENIDEAADGTISGAIEELLDAGKRRRVLKDTTPIQRGIIRHLVLILDLSSAMLEKDLRPTRYLLTLRYASEFVTEYFEQNPISQLCVVGMRDGLAVPVTGMGGNPSEHVAALEALRAQEPRGDASLQNAFNMARGALYHAPAHGTREILLVYGSLLSSDPGDIHRTIADLVAARVVATVVGLAAEVAVCRTLVARTNPALPVADAYGVALNEQHYRELFMRATTPPATGAVVRQDASAGQDGDDDDPDAAGLLMMGFPSRSVESASSLCACHSKPTRAGYTCSRCASKVCALPSTCPVCSLTLILSTHLARSYHHLFPLRNWIEVPWARAATRPEQSACFGCLADFPPVPGDLDALAKAVDGRQTLAPRERDKGVSESGRYECETCGKFFCIDCDMFSHEVVHNCPGCQSSATVGDGTAMDVTPLNDGAGPPGSSSLQQHTVNGARVNGTVA